MTLPLFDRGAADRSRLSVDRLIAALQGRGWRTAKVLASELSVSDRDLRQAAHDSHGQIVGGNEGYRLTRECPKDEYERATGRIRSQIRRETQRLVELERVYHRRTTEAA